MPQSPTARTRPTLRLPWLSVFVVGKTKSVPCVHYRSSFRVQRPCRFYKSNFNFHGYRVVALPASSKDSQAFHKHDSRSMHTAYTPVFHGCLRLWKGKQSQSRVYAIAVLSVYKGLVVFTSPTLIFSVIVLLLYLHPQDSQAFHKHDSRSMHTACGC